MPHGHFVIYIFKLFKKKFECLKIMKKLNNSLIYWTFFLCVCNTGYNHQNFKK